MKINFIGAVYSPSGYGEFSRYFIHALDSIGLNVNVEAIMLDANLQKDFGVKGATVKKLTKKMRKPDINIINMLPIFFPRFRKPGCLNLGFTMWEADKLPSSWVKACNEMDAILVPCSWNKVVFETSGVNVPIYVVTPGVVSDEMPALKEKPESKTFNFYSIFQWSERKDPQGLIRAFVSEFSNGEDVSLILKTYRVARLPNDGDLITNDVRNIVEDLNIKNPPKIKLLTKILSKGDMDKLHLNSHCFVLPHRGEGWGMPHMEAMTFGNPVIATNYSGNTDFMTSTNSYLLNYTTTPATSMKWLAQWYDGTMMWAQADLGDLKSKMREVFSNRELAKEKGLLGRSDIVERFNEKTSADQLKSAMKDLMGVK